MNILTITIFMNINFFCSSFITEEPDCVSEIVQCYLDDAYTVEQCKIEYLGGEIDE